MKAERTICGAAAILVVFFTWADFANNLFFHRVVEAVFEEEGGTARLQAALGTIAAAALLLYGWRERGAPGSGRGGGRLLALVGLIASLQILQSVYGAYTVHGLGRKLSSIDSNVDSIQSDVGTIQTDVSSVQSDVGSIQGDQSNIESALDDTKSRVDDIATRLNAP